MTPPLWHMQHPHNELYYNYNAQSVEVDKIDIWPWGAECTAPACVSIQITLTQTNLNMNESAFVGENENISTRTPPLPMSGKAVPRCSGLSDVPAKGKLCTQYIYNGPNWVAIQNNIHINCINPSLDVYWKGYAVSDNETQQHVIWTQDKHCDWQHYPTAVAALRLQTLWLGECAKINGVIVIPQTRRMGKTGERRARGNSGEGTWQWLRRWGFDSKVTKSSNKMRLVD